MSYAVVYEAQAQEDFASLPEPVRSTIMGEVQRMAQSPVTHARRFPSASGRGMMFRIRSRYDSMDVFADVTFEYGQDEQTIYVGRVYVEYL